MKDTAMLPVRRREISHSIRITYSEVFPRDYYRSSRQFKKKKEIRTSWLSDSRRIELQDQKYEENDIIREMTGKNGKIELEQTENFTYFFLEIEQCSNNFSGEHHFGIWLQELL